MLDAENNELECLEGEPKPEVASQEIQPLRAQVATCKVPPNKQKFRLNFTNFCEIDKTQMNKVFNGLDGMSHDQRLHCFIRSPANANGNEWFFEYTNTKTEFVPRSETIVDAA